MKLRKLETKDAARMLKWMHDETVTRHLNTDFYLKTLEDCYQFIADSWQDSFNLHLAIVDINDIYMGTVSLKNKFGSSAEFGISICADAMGKGYAKYAMERILQIGFEEERLDMVYWCVSLDNKRAIRFYDKNGYQRFHIMERTYGGLLHSILKCSKYTQAQIESYLWYIEKRDGQNG